jgi:transmembrane sensor
MRSDEVRIQGWTDGIEPWRDDSETDPIHSEAAAWLARLGRPLNSVSRKDISEFREWRDKDGRHAAAFVRLVEVSYMASATSAQRDWNARRLAEDSYDGEVPLGKWIEAPRLPRLLYAIAASVALAIALGTTFFQVIQMGLAPPAPVTTFAEEIFETPVGKNKAVVLSDGSRLTLGGRTHLGVTLTNNQRVVRLYRGEAYFEVAKDAGRSFVVRVGSITVTAVGTAFNVNQADERSVVTVTEGQVLVEPNAQMRGNSQAIGVRLAAGEQSTASEKGIGKATSVADLPSILSWQSGRLSFRQLPLRHVIQDVNRYTPKQLAVATSRVGDIVVTGTVSPGNIGGWLRSLERAFELKAIEESDRITLYESVEAQARQ